MSSNSQLNIVDHANMDKVCKSLLPKMFTTRKELWLNVQPPSFSVRSIMSSDPQNNSLNRDQNEIVVYLLSISHFQPCDVAVVVMCLMIFNAMLRKWSIDFSNDIFFCYFSFSFICFWVVWILACGQRCYLIEYFNFSWYKFKTSSKKGFCLFSAIDVSFWKLIYLAKVGEWMLIVMRVITDEQIITKTKAWCDTRIHGK